MTHEIHPLLKGRKRRKKIGEGQAGRKEGRKESKVEGRTESFDNCEEREVFFPLRLPGFLYDFLFGNKRTPYNICREREGGGFML